VPIRTDAEEDEIEGVRKLDVRRPEGMDLRLGHLDLGQERLAREALIRELVIRRNIALIAPPDVPRGPVEPHPGEAFVHRADRRPARERDAELPRARPFRDPAGGVLC
jgi:hypothetical protein